MFPSRRRDFDMAGNKYMVEDVLHNECASCGLSMTLRIPVIYPPALNREQLA